MCGGKGIDSAFDAFSERSHCSCECGLPGYHRHLRTCWHLKHHFCGIDVVLLTAFFGVHTTLVVLMSFVLTVQSGGSVNEVPISISILFYSYLPCSFLSDSILSYSI